MRRCDGCPRSVRNSGASARQGWPCAPRSVEFGDRGALFWFFFGQAKNEQERRQRRCDYLEHEYRERPNEKDANKA